MAAANLVAIGLLLTLPAVLFVAAVIHKRRPKTRFLMVLWLTFNAAAIGWLIGLRLVRDPCEALPLPAGCDPDPLLPYWSDVLFLFYVIPGWLLGNAVLGSLALVTSKWMPKRNSDGPSDSAAHFSSGSERR